MTTRNAQYQAGYRQRLRRQGMRLLQVWVPDTQAPGFLAEYRRQADLLAATYADDADTQWWLDQAEAGFDELYRDEP